MYCVACKSTTSLPGARYCVRCGAPLQALLWSDSASEEKGTPAEDRAEPSIACPRCGRMNPMGNRHCAFCGAQLDAPGRATGGQDPARAAELVDAAAQALARGQVDRARAQSEEAVTLHPGSARAHAVLAEALHQSGSLGGALQAMTTALRLEPTNAEYERRLRELRDEQDRAVAPILSSLGERELRRRRRPRPARPAPQPRFRAPRSSRVSLPPWLRSAAVVLGAMAVLAAVQWASARSVLASSAVQGVGFFLMITLGVIITLFVYNDARSRGMPPAMVWMWTAVVLLSNFLVPGYGFLSLLVYLLVTRSSR